MRKEIIGILLFFIVVFTLISLVSYSPSDPSIFNPGAKGEIHNMFGMLGAHLSGILERLFGLGVFWIPILSLLLSIHFFSGQQGKAVVLTIIGGILLIITTGSLFALKQNYYVIFGSKFSAGGIAGTWFKSYVIRYSNSTGGIIIFILLWIIGLIMSTGLSLVRFIRSWVNIVHIFRDRAKTIYLKRKERREKAKKRLKTEKDKTANKVQEIKIKPSKTKPIKAMPAPKQEVFDFMKTNAGFQLPSFNLLKSAEIRHVDADNENLRMQSKLVEKKLEDFGVKGQVVEVSPGPVITTFEYKPAAGIKINKIVNLTDDLALALRATSIRIVAPIPGKAVIGIEIPNAERQIVRFKEVVASSIFGKAKSKLTICLGKDIVGNPVIAELDKMPHLLIAGATGAGKSVALNAMICSLLYKSVPEDVKIIMIDPKRIELTLYDGIPHLITPVVTDVKKATNALFWAVNEMERRYGLLAEKKVRNIVQYNDKVEAEKLRGEEIEGHKKLPYIVIIIDELADLMVVASRDVEVSLMRLAQMARAAGIHLILATQRPSVDVLTGIIKANFPTRLTFQVSSKIDSRTIIDTNGAQNLLGAGDMLFLPPGTARLQRIHGAYISEKELQKITDFLKEQAEPEYDETVLEPQPSGKAKSKDEEYDERYDDAVALITKTRQASISSIQRHLRIGYNRAARIIEVMEREGIVGPSDGAKPRDVLVAGYDDDM